MQLQVDSLTGKLFPEMAHTIGIRHEILALVGKPLTTSYIARRKKESSCFKCCRKNHQALECEEGYVF